MPGCDEGSGSEKPTIEAEKSDVDGAKQMKPTDAKLARSQQSHIGSQLRQMYDGLVNEPIPDHLLKLLEQVDESEAGSDDDGAGEGEATT